MMPRDVERAIDADIDASEHPVEICWHCQHSKAWHDLILGCDYITDDKDCECREYQF